MRLKTLSRTICRRYDRRAVAPRCPVRRRAGRRPRSSRGRRRACSAEPVRSSLRSSPCAQPHECLADAELTRPLPEDFEFVPVGLRHDDVASRHVVRPADAHHDGRLLAGAPLDEVPLDDVPLFALVPDASQRRTRTSIWSRTSRNLARRSSRPPSALAGSSRGQYSRVPLPGNRGQSFSIRSQTVMTCSNCAVPMNSWNPFGSLSADVDPAFRHHGDRQRVKIARHRAGAMCLEGVPRQGAQEGFRHLAARAVGAGEKENLPDHLCLLTRNLTKMILAVSKPEAMARRQAKTRRNLGGT